MTRLIAPTAGPQQCVTASDLVRHFGVWQERAARAPVYVMHRGRPRFALTSLEVMEALCAPHAVDAHDDLAIAALLDAGDEIAVIVDNAGMITAASRAARARFGDGVRSGSPLATFTLAGGGFLSDAVVRVLASGIGEEVEVIPARYPTRRVACAVTPFPGGCLIRTRDLTTEEELGALRAQTAAVGAAAAAAGTVITRIGLRGYLVEPCPALARLTGVARDALETARFVSLIDVAGRVAVGDAIEAAITDARSRSIATAMLVRGASSVPVTIGIAAARTGSRVDEVIAAIMPTATI